MPLYEETAPASPLKKVKSSHFPPGSPHSLAVAAATNAYANRDMGEEVEGGEGAFFGGRVSGGGGECI